VQIGVPAPAFSTALAFYDGYRCERLPANLLQAQRDYFGAHTYERVDRPRGRVLPHQLDRARRHGGLDRIHGLRRKTRTWISV
jgi:6-phosphogluconate dehydrogenase